VTARAVPWPAAANVRAYFSERRGGVSAAPFDSMNPASHVGDDPAAVAANRDGLLAGCRVPTAPGWLRQVHGTDVLDAGADRIVDDVTEADGVYTDRPGTVLCIQVADCLPIFLCNREGTEVALLHAGWRGLAGGIIARGVARFRSRDLLAWVGPGIGSCHYEVDTPVHDALSAYEPAFSPSTPGHWDLDLKAIAVLQLGEAGVRDVGCDPACTHCERDRFFSARRDGQCGRMAALAWFG